MILVGQNDSPFVRRVAVTLRHYGVAYERNPLSVFADYDAVCALHRFLGYYHPHLATAGRYPALDRLAARCEALPAFQAVPLVEG